jgi:hypothetical protein
MDTKNSDGIIAGISFKTAGKTKERGRKMRLLKISNV